MNNNILFNEIEEKEILKILKSIDSETKIIEKNRSIVITNNDSNIIGIILNGNANLEMYDYNGNRIIIEKLVKNDFFINWLYNSKNETMFVAKSNCEVLLFKYDVFLKKIKNSNILINMLDMYSKKVKSLNIRLEILSKRSTKDKLLTYFLTLANYKKNKSFILPSTMTDLADYLSVDRSAMMREIKKLKDEKYIKIDGKKITIINY